MKKGLSSSLSKQIKQADIILKHGGVIAFPTETVYGLGISMSVPESAQRIYQIKERDHTKALSFILSDVSQLDQVAVSITEVAWQLISRFWPGPLTLIFTKSKSVSELFTSGNQTVAVRVSSHTVARAIVAEHGAPITATSANISGKPNLLTAEEVKMELGNKIDYIVDCGKCPGGPESTIIDVTKELPVMLREGAISRAIVQTVCKLQ